MLDWWYTALRLLHAFMNSHNDKNAMDMLPAWMMDVLVRVCVFVCVCLERSSVDLDRGIVVRVDEMLWGEVIYMFGFLCGGASRDGLYLEQSKCLISPACFVRETYALHEHGTHKRI